MIKLTCKICNTPIEFTDARGLSKFINHIKTHNISAKDYYDQYINFNDGCCKVCNKPTKFLSILRGYAPTCSKTCSQINARTHITADSIQQAINNSRKTKLEKYGDENYNNQTKSKQTKLEKYGDEYYSNQEKAKQTKLEKYGDEYYSNREKAKQTCLKQYGTEHYTNREKCFDTFKAKYGTEYIFTDETIKQKIKDTKLNKYNDEYFTNREQFIKTCIDRYNVNNVFQVDSIKEKIKDTLTDKYGVDHVFKSKTIQKQIKSTNIEKYGVEYPMQNKDIFNKSKSKYTFDNKIFDSSWELAYYIYLKDHNTDFEYQPNLSFTYYVNDNPHIYNPDFLVNNKLYEIKGLQFFNNKDTNDKMINPFDRTQDDLYEAKHQCMLKNNVQIITDCSEYINYVNKKYTNDFIPLFKNNLEFPYLNNDLHDISDIGLIHHFHKSIYEANRKNKPSPIKAWQNKNLIYKCALNRLKYIGSCKPSDILQGFNVTKIAAKISVFKPSLAESLIKKYIPDADIIIDPFSGFSGRLLGAFNCNKQYIGFDINEKHVNESNEIINYKVISDMCKVTVQDILTANITDWNYLKDVCLFTCPPYGGKEHWNKDNDEIELTCDEWIDICLEKHKCKSYLFVVDKTIKYKNYIVDKIENKSHFGKNNEYIILIKS